MSDYLTSSKLKKWTVMFYLAGDNNLESYALKDLSEMKKADSSVDVAIVAQLDRMADEITRRYFITSNQNLETSCVAELDEINTGDPKALLDFIKWTIETHPAERYALVLWNHGSGWKDDDIYKIAKEKEIAGKVMRGQIRGLTSGKISRALFRSSLENLVIDSAQKERAILFDDSSADFLDSIELRYVLEEVVKQIGRPLDLLGFDACLMSMLEVNYQIRDLCRVVVSSQEIEPGDGWTYDAILTFLNGNPDMTPEDLGRAIVDTYVAFYQTHFPNLSVTQSAVLIKGIEELSNVVDNLAQLLIDSLHNPDTLGLIFSALRTAQRFSDHDYVDLSHFCQVLTRSDAEGRIGTAAEMVTDFIHSKSGPVIAEGHHGPNVTNSCGLSIYLPTRNLSPLYHRLEFALHHSWDEFLIAFLQQS